MSQRLCIVHIPGRTVLVENSCCGNVLPYLVRMWMCELCTFQVFGSQLGVEPVTAAMLAVGCLLATGVLSWSDCLAYTAAWDTLIWFTGELIGRATP